jgi:uncharacterized coiled-coil protein SlyX
VVRGGTAADLLPNTQDLAMDFRSDPNLKPTEIQTPTPEQRTPVVLAHKPGTRARLRRSLRKGGTIALNGGILVLNLHSRLLIKSSLLDKRISLAIAFLIIFSVGVAASFVWRSSRQVVSVPQAAPAPTALSPSLEQQLEAMSSSLAAVRQSVDGLSSGLAQIQQLEAMSSSLAAVRQSVDGLSSGLAQMKRDITNLQTTAQALFDKISEPPPRPAAVLPPARSTPRLPQAPTSAR